MLISFLGFAQYTYIPDDNFEQALINLGYDDVLDNQILTSNISNVTELNVSEMMINDLTGIQSFRLLEELNCSFNELNGLDVSQNLNLKKLTCGGGG